MAMFMLCIIDSSLDPGLDDLDHNVMPSPGIRDYLHLIIISEGQC